MRGTRNLIWLQQRFHCEQEQSQKNEDWLKDENGCLSAIMAYKNAVAQKYPKKIKLNEMFSAQMIM